jgi:hypothetical protein
VVEIGAQEGREVWSSLAHDEVVYVEELGYTVEWGFAVTVRGLCVRAKGGFRGRGPGGDVPFFVFAEHCYGVVEGGRGCGV